MNEKVTTSPWDVNKNWLATPAIPTSPRLAWSEQWKMRKLLHPNFKPKKNWLRKLSNGHFGPDISIPGIRRLYDPRYSTCQKIFWILAITGCATICAFQVGDRLQYYLKTPIILDSTVIRNQTFAFPAVTLCPGTVKFDFVSTLSRLIKRTFMESNLSVPENIESFNISKLNLSLHKMWDECMLRADDVYVATPCSGTDDENCTDDDYVIYPVEKSCLQTLWGNCLILTPKSDMLYRGPDTYLKLNIKERPEPWAGSNAQGARPLKRPQFKPDQERISRMSLQFFLHKKGLRLRHDSSFRVESLLRHYYTQVRFTIKEFNYLNYSGKTCYEELEVTKCRNNFMDRRMDEILNCSLPFLTHSHLPLCTTLADAKYAFFKASDFYSEVKTVDLACGRPCQEIIYSLTTDVVYPLGDGRSMETIMQLYYPDSLFERMHEEYAYLFAAFFSDVSANLGFFLGFCMLTLVEMVEALFKRN